MLKVQTQAQRWAAYQICQQRTHEPNGITLTSNPPWSVCKHCGTWFREVVTVVEGNVPKPPYDLPTPGGPDGR